MQFCVDCGAPFSPHGSFCARCGTVVRDGVAAEVADITMEYAGSAYALQVSAGSRARSARLFEPSAKSLEVGAGD